MELEERMQKIADLKGVQTEIAWEIKLGHMYSVHILWLKTIEAIMKREVWKRLWMERLMGLLMHI